ncbi:MAG: MFS transporter [Streptosporangiaceae bacterium]
MTATRPSPTSHLVRLTAAQTAGQAGTWAGYTAALPTALSQTHPAVVVSIITAAWTIPSIFAWLAGSLIDRHGPRRTGAAAWSLATLAALVPAATRPTLPVLIPVLAVLALGSTWAVAAGEAAPTWMPSRPHPATAGTALAAATNLTLIIGPAGAANLLTYTSDRAAWALVAALSLTAALTTLRIPATAPPPAASDSQPPGQDPAMVRAVLAITAGFYLTLGLITVAEPLYVRQLLRAGLPVYGWLLAAVGAAGILTSITAGHRDTIITGRWAVPAAALTVAAGETLYLTTPILACAFTGAAVFGTGSTLFRLSTRAIIVRNTPGGQHGRALSGWETVQCLPSVVSTAATGPLISLFGLHAVLRGCSALAIVTAAATLRPTRPKATRYRYHTTHPAADPPPVTPQEAAPHRASQWPTLPGTPPISGTCWPPPGPPIPNPARYRLPRPGQTRSS